MDSHFRNFKTAISPEIIPKELNNPFDQSTPEICKVAAEELQQFLTENQNNWAHHFGVEKSKEGPIRGKMFGVLVAQNNKGELGYLSAFSGVLAQRDHHPNFVLTQFDFAAEDYFLDRKMTELTTIGNEISALIDKGVDQNAKEVHDLKALRRTKSIALQDKIFDCYAFTNKQNESKSLKDIFQDYQNTVPPGGAGECTAPKLLQYALENHYTPLGIAEFWWGQPRKSDDRIHRHFYPACESKCRPILTYMLDLKKVL